MNDLELKFKMERRIPLTVIAVLLVQLASALIWATQLEARVSGVEKESVSANTLNEKFARLDERLDGMKQNLEEMKHQIDRITDRLLK